MLLMGGSTKLNLLTDLSTVLHFPLKQKVKITQSFLNVILTNYISFKQNEPRGRLN